MKKPLSILVTFVTVSLLLLCAAAGCSSDESDTGGDEEYSIQVSAGGQVVSVTLTDLQSLPEVTVEGSGKTQTGPTLLSVLDYAGVTEFSKVTVAGLSKGRVATAELELDSDEITEEVVLDFNNQGKTKLAGPDIPEDSWIIDVEEIRAE